MPKMQITLAEADLVLRNRHRLKLDNHDWNSEPWVRDVDLWEMSAPVAERIVMSDVWIRDYLALCYRNIRHPDNQQWYLEWLAGQLGLGAITHDEMHARIAKMPVYGKEW